MLEICDKIRIRNNYSTSLYIIFLFTKVDLEQLRLNYFIITKRNPKTMYSDWILYENQHNHRLLYEPVRQPRVKIVLSKIDLMSFAHIQKQSILPIQNID